MPISSATPDKLHFYCIFKVLLSQSRNREHLCPGKPFGTGTIAKPHKTVKTGVRNRLKTQDSGFRRNDDD